MAVNRFQQSIDFQVSNAGDAELPKTPTNKLLYDAIKDRGTAYLMVFRELNARYGEKERETSELSPRNLAECHCE